MYPTGNRDYSLYVDDGFEELSKAEVLVVGLARDCDDTLGLNIDRFRTISKDVDFFIVENDSVDYTKRILQESNIGHRCYTYGYPKLKDRSLLRRTIMSDMRNIYLDYIKTYESIYDYVIVYDFDIKGGFSYEGLAHSISALNRTSDLLGLTSNGIMYRVDDEKSKYIDRVFYDTWAFRSEDERFRLDNLNLLKFNRGEDIIRVSSNFGGMAVYKSMTFTNHDLSYKNHDCDHVTLHEQLPKNSIGLNPNQLVIYNGHYYVGNT